MLVCRVALAVVLVAGTLLASTGCGTAQAPCRVAGDMPAEESAALLESCERVIPAVEAAWVGWEPEVLIARSPEPLPSGIAARVEGVARDGEPATGDRLVVTPGLPEQLSPEGLDVVLRHELTHLAMRSTGTAPIPLWVAEGLAEYVAYDAVPDDRRARGTELEQLRARVDAGDWEGTVPSASQLEAVGAGTDTTVTADAYTAAWLGITVLVADRGLDPVIAAMHLDAMHLDAIHPDDTRPGELSDADREALFLDRLGVTRPELDRWWRAALAEDGPR